MIKLANNKPQYRNEFKHLITAHDKVILKSRLKAVMKPDGNVNEQGNYFIRSLYFDTYDDKALIEKEDGVAFRNKYRIRYYNLDDSFIKLENKIKHYGACLKPNAKISKEEVLRILNGDYEFLKNDEAALKRDLYIQLTSGGLVPKTVVDYVRTPFVNALGNVRVTIDSDLKAPLGMLDFFNPNMPMCSIFPDGSSILEVKYDTFIPEFISNIIQIPTTKTSAYSKYAFCRRFL